jgi:hypothetical protein
MKKIISVLQFIVVSVITLVFYELYFGLTEISEPSHYQLDEKLGYVLEPSEHVMLIEEGMYIGGSNKFGYWAKAYAPERTPNSLRIALMGSSYVAGLQLPEKFHFRAIMEDKLQKISDEKIEVLNFGKSGQHFDRVLISYNEHVKQYNPDIVLVFVTSGTFLTRESEIGPEFYVENDSLKIDYTFNKSPQYNFLKSTEFFRSYALYSLVQKCWALYRKGETNKILFDKLYNLFKKDNPNNPGNNDNSVEDNYYEVNKAILKSFSEVNKSSNTEVIIVEMENIPDRYKELIEEYNLPKIELYTYLDKLQESGHKLNYWKATNQLGHWNHEAQVFVGEYLAYNLKKKMMSENYITTSGK